VVNEPARDPILEQRARVRRIADLAKRVGYLLFALTLVLFFVALATGFSGGMATAATITLIAGCIVLAPAILLGYAVTGAERDEEERGLG
jgi:hypothetical protein